MAKKNDLSKVSFEEAIESLTDIVSNIESGETPLQTSLDQYEKGMDLIAHCRSILTAAEKRIEKIAKKDEDSKVSKDPDTDEGDSEKELF